MYVSVYVHECMSVCVCKCVCVHAIAHVCAWVCTCMFVHILSLLIGLSAYFYITVCMGQVTMVLP